MGLSTYSRKAIIGLSLVAGFLPSLPVRAQSADPMDQAQELFRAGRDEAKNDNCKAAIPLFDASYRMYAARGTLYNLALCEEKIGRFASAWTHFQELLPQLPPDDERLSETKEKISSLGSRIAMIRFELAVGAPAGTTVTLDGAELSPGRLGTEFPLDAGQYVVLVKASGYDDRRYQLALTAGGRETLTLEVGEPLVKPGSASGTQKSAAPAGERADAGGGDRALAAGFVVGGVGLTGLGVMAITGILALGKKGELERACPDPSRCTASGVSLARDGNTLTTVSTVAALVGLVGAGAGVVLLVWSGRGAKMARLGPAVWANGGGAVLEGRF